MYFQNVHQNTSIYFFTHTQNERYFSFSVVQKICGETHPPTCLVYFLLSYFNRFNKQKNQKSTMRKRHKNLSVKGIGELCVLALVTLPCRKPSYFKGQGPACPWQPSCCVYIRPTGTRCTLPCKELSVSTFCRRGREHAQWSGAGYPGI